MKTRKFNFLHILLMMGLIVLPISCDEEAFLEEDLRDALSPATFYNNDAEASLAVNGVMMGLILPMVIETDNMLQCLIMDLMKEVLQEEM